MNLFTSKTEFCRIKHIFKHHSFVNRWQLECRDQPYKNEFNCQVLSGESDSSFYPANWKGRRLFEGVSSTRGEN